MPVLEPGTEGPRAAAGRTRNHKAKDSTRHDDRYARHPLLTYFCRMNVRALMNKTRIALIASVALLAVYGFTSRVPRAWWTGVRPKVGTEHR